MQITRVVFAFAVAISTAVATPVSKAGDCINAGEHVQNSLRATLNVNEKLNMDFAHPPGLGSQLRYDADDMTLSSQRPQEEAMENALPLNSDEPRYSGSKPDANSLRSVSAKKPGCIVDVDEQDFISSSASIKVCSTQQNPIESRTQLAQPEINTPQPPKARDLVKVPAQGQQQIPVKQQTQQPHNNGDLVSDLQDQSGRFQMVTGNLQRGNVQMDRHCDIRRGQDSQAGSGATPSTSLNKQKRRAMLQAECGREKMPLDGGNDNQEDARLRTAQRGVVHVETTRGSVPQMGQENHKESWSHVDESAVLPKKQQQQQVETQMEMAESSLYRAAASTSRSFAAFDLPPCITGTNDILEQTLCVCWIAVCDSNGRKLGRWELGRSGFPVENGCHGVGQEGFAAWYSPFLQSSSLLSRRQLWFGFGFGRCERAGLSTSKTLSCHAVFSDPFMAVEVPTSRA